LLCGNDWTSGDKGWFTLKNDFGLWFGLSNKSSASQSEDVSDLAFILNCLELVWFEEDEMEDIFRSLLWKSRLFVSKSSFVFKESSVGIYVKLLSEEVYRWWSTKSLEGTGKASVDDTLLEESFSCEIIWIGDSVIFESDNSKLDQGDGAFDG
jgi:hypothetical protein